MPKRTIDYLDGYSLALRQLDTGVDLVLEDDEAGHEVHLPLPFEAALALGRGLVELGEPAGPDPTELEGDILRDSKIEPERAADHLAQAEGTPQPPEPDAEASLPRCPKCGARDLSECAAMPGGPQGYDPSLHEEFAEQGCALALNIVNSR